MISFRALRLPLAIFPLAALPCLVPMHQAHAQMSVGSGGPGGGGGLAGGGLGGGDSGAEEDAAKANAAANAPPPALPGAVSTDPAAPSGHAALDMDPTAALFDAINRGDLTAAKEALSRGADLAGTNVLGEKPIEASIDLNRNDITFLLLSMRNSDAAPGGAQVATDTASARSNKSGGIAINARSTRSHGPVQEASYSRSRRSDDGGVAKPEVGFLGFGGS
jgi:hypothetical protein